MRRQPCIIYVGLKCHHRCSDNREMRHTQRGEGDVKMQAEIGAMLVRECWTPQEAGRGKERILL